MAKRTTEELNKLAELPLAAEIHPEKKKFEKLSAIYEGEDFKYKISKDCVQIIKEHNKYLTIQNSELENLIAGLTKVYTIVKANEV
ncbi:hypothetical protein OXPF_39630 [Oxobacter pfennigii]|uniref:Uncharacterized protein n=1 Tax=Oxobacter pfennigii TaxID=36849 RepID=A0A0N8NSJ2_9CLOT|nr:hypothetical protein [Oxobacter pfennigii]KPU42184.1 hypothetical protein OXPF_39630 [Oxobacter pfennigii]